MNKTQTSKRIWRTVVFAGAMLGAGAVGCGSKKPQTTPVEKGPAVGDDQAKKDADMKMKADADKKAADDAAAKEVEDKKAADELAMKQAEEEAAKAKAEEEAAKKRPRGGNSRPSGRGFVLA